jgi:hypothetical protein
MSCPKRLCGVPHGKATHRHRFLEGNRDGFEVRRSSMTMVRLGNVIYWLGCIAAGITLATGAFEAVAGAFDSPWHFLIVALIAAVIWIAGWGFRHFYSRI